MTQPGLFDIKDKDVAGRIGKLFTPRGPLETPTLLPVIDITRQDVPLDVIKQLGFNAVITNAYLLWKRMGDLVAEKGVHSSLGFDGIVMTDSGAYQLLQYGRIDVDQETIINFEKKIGSDIAVILDVPTGNARSRRQAMESVETTLARAREALAIIDPDRRIWTLPIQGGQFLDLLAYSASESAKLLGPYRLLALGSPTVLLERYDYATLVQMILTVRQKIPWSIPLHLFGAGHPMIIPFAVALGVDLFDSASYILYARDNRIMTETRTYRLEELEYMPCSTPICVKYTPKELLEMPRQERVRLLATHNLHVLASTIRQVKQAIKEGRLWELLEERSHGHPSLLRAYNVLSRARRYLLQHSPRLKGGKAKGIFIYGAESLSHPRILQHQVMVTARYKRPEGKALAVLIPISEKSKPFTRSKLYLRFRNRTSAHIVGYTLAIGAVPEELAETYPLSQYEISGVSYSEVLQETAHRIEAYVTSQNYSAIVVVTCKDIEWSRPLAQRIVELLKRSKNNYSVEIEFVDECNG